MQVSEKLAVLALDFFSAVLGWIWQPIEDWLRWRRVEARLMAFGAGEVPISKYDVRTVAFAITGMEDRLCACPPGSAAGGVLFDAPPWEGV
jgi:hypothetical protein